MNNISYLANAEGETQLKYFGEPIDYYFSNTTDDTVCIQGAAFAVYYGFDAEGPLEIFISDGETKHRLAYITSTQDMVTFFPLISTFIKNYSVCRTDFKTPLQLPSGYSIGLTLNGKVGTNTTRVQIQWNTLSDAKKYDIATTKGRFDV